MELLRHSISEIKKSTDFIEHVVNELDLVRDLGTTQDGQEGALGLLEGLGEVVELLLDEETGSLLGKVDTDHGAVSTVGSTESVVCKNHVSMTRVCHVVLICALLM